MKSIYIKVDVDDIARVALLITTRSSIAAALQNLGVNLQSNRSGFAVGVQHSRLSRLSLHRTRLLCKVIRDQLDDTRLSGYMTPDLVSEPRRIEGLAFASQKFS